MSPAIKAFALAVIAIAVTLPAYADPPGRVGRLSLVSGAVSLAPAGLDDQWSEAYINRPITTGDRLWVAERSRAEIRIGSAAVRLDATTSADVLNVDDRLVQLRLGEGRMQLRIRALPPDGVYEIDTPGAAIVIREPGAYRIDVRPDADVATLVVRSGSADISGSRASLDVRAGESIVFENGGESYDFRSIAQDDFDRFYLARDARDDQRRPRYVSAEMTGYEDLDEYGSWSDVPDYGNVWFPTRVDAGWVPYRDGRWIWVEPWGWTWVDNATWGFAPFHYGRWVRVRDRWGWCPGEAQARPIYAPALVAWVGGPGFNVSVASGAAPVVGWFPLAYREPYIPWYETSPAYVREVNVAARITNINVTNINVTQINYRYRRDSVAVTAVPATVVAQAQPITRAVVRLQPQRLEQATIVAGAPHVAPAQQSVIVRQTSVRPPPSVERRAVVAVQTPPPAPAPFSERQRALPQRGDQPFKVQPLPPRAPTAVQPSPAAPSGTPAPGGAATASRAPVGAATPAVATVAPVQVIKPPAPQARAAGAPPPSARAPAPGAAETAGGAPPGRQATERPGSPAAMNERPGAAPGAAAIAAPGASESPKAASEAPRMPTEPQKPATEAPKRPPEVPKQAPAPPVRALPSAPSAERPGPGREVEPVRPPPATTPTPAPRDLTPRAAPEAAPPTRTPSERATPRTPPEAVTPPRASPTPLPERVTPGPERAAPREAAPTPRAAPPSPERIVPQTQERAAPGPLERAAPVAPPPRVVPAQPVERAAPRETPAMPRAAPMPERPPQPMPERAAPAPQERAAPAAPRAAPPAPPVERSAPRGAPAPQRAAPPVERSAPREAPAPQRAAPPAERGGQGAGRGPTKEPPEKGRSPDEKGREEPKG